MNSWEDGTDGRTPVAQWSGWVPVDHQHYNFGAPENIESSDGGVPIFTLDDVGRVELTVEFSATPPEGVAGDDDILSVVAHVHEPTDLRGWDGTPTIPEFPEVLLPGRWEVFVSRRPGADEDCEEHHLVCVPERADLLPAPDELAASMAGAPDMEPIPATVTASGDLTVTFESRGDPEIDVPRAEVRRSSEGLVVACSPGAACMLMVEEVDFIYDEGDRWEIAAGPVPVLGPVVLRGGVRPHEAVEVLRSGPGVLTIALPSATRPEDRGREVLIHLECDVPLG